MDYPDPTVEGTQDQVIGQAGGVETAETADRVAALLAVVNATMLLAGAVGLITGLLFGVLIGRRTAPPPPRAWRRLQR